MIICRACCVKSNVFWRVLKAFGVGSGETKRDDNVFSGATEPAAAVAISKQPAARPPNILLFFNN